MLRLTGIAAMLVTFVFSEEFECFDHSDCINRFGADSKCTKQKRGPTCALVSRCTNIDPDSQWDLQSCDCKHLHNGMCMSETESCGSVVTGVCPEREGMTWECCANTI